MAPRSSSRPGPSHRDTRTSRSGAGWEGGGTHGDHWPNHSAPRTSARAAHLRPFVLHPRAGDRRLQRIATLARLSQRTHSANAPKAPPPARVPGRPSPNPPPSRPSKLLHWMVVPRSHTPYPLGYLADLNLTSSTRSSLASATLSTPRLSPEALRSALPAGSRPPTAPASRCRTPRASRCVAPSCWGLASGVRPGDPR
jgi:hypothetical protein